MDEIGWVLVVETGDAARGGLERDLVAAGCTVTRVDSREALAAVGRGGAIPDLIVTPWKLGTHTDGLRLHRAVAERTPGIASLILFRPEDVDRLPEAPLPPGVRLLSDPYDAGRLLSSARGAVAEARALRRP